MSGIVIWSVAALLYGGFLAWYCNWRRPLSPAEVDGWMQRFAATDPQAGERNDLGILRAFLAADDGREFFMLNVVRVSDGDVPDPVTGVMRPARDVLDGYTRSFLPALARRAGHPAIVARKVGGYFDAWGVEPDPGWTIMGYMRYRSRRDLVELVCQPQFAGAHDFKFAAMPQTFSFPTRPMIMALQGPVVWVALVLALLAALIHLSVLV